MQREGSPASRDGAADHRDTDAVKRALRLLVTIATHLVVEICGHKEQTRSNQPYGPPNGTRVGFRGSVLGTRLARGVQRLTDDICGRTQATRSIK